MQILIASDHAGYELKTYLISFLKKNKKKVSDLGCFTSESVDYPDFAHVLAKEISVNPDWKGILICGSGNGVAMTANKYKNVRAALCWDSKVTELARSHNDANILCLPARFISLEKASEMVLIFLNTNFEKGRHLKRVKKINLDNECCSS